MKKTSPFVIDVNQYRDSRGFFCELWKFAEICELTGHDEWQQVNWSRSGKNVLRGLHFQRPPHAQAKLICVINGSVWDVCVDLRAETFGQQHFFELSGDKPQLLFVPEGFAHGFANTAENTDFLYRCTSLYNREAEGGLPWNDPTLNIQWPHPHPHLSAQDQNWPALLAQKTDLQRLVWNR